MYRHDWNLDVLKHSCAPAAGDIVGGDVVVWRNGVSEGLQILLCILDNLVRPGNTNLKDI